MVYPFLRDKKDNPDPSSIFRARRDLLRPKENKPTIPRITNQSERPAQAGHFPLCMSLQVQTPISTATSFDQALFLRAYETAQRMI
jgi:hypothetical protein